MSQGQVTGIFFFVSEILLLDLSFLHYLKLKMLGDITFILFSRGFMMHNFGFLSLFQSRSCFLLQFNLPLNIL